VPWVTIRTGVVAADGQEIVLTEYLCDWPRCAHVAEHVVGFVRTASITRALCPEHNAMMNRAPDSRTD
jgi:hypothetical protein